MDSKIILGKLLQRFVDDGTAQVKGYSNFIYLNETDTYVEVLRKKRTKAKIYFSTLIDAINFYNKNIHAYDDGPTAFRRIGITHVTSPVFVILHLLPASTYQ